MYNITLDGMTISVNHDTIPFVIASKCTRKFIDFYKLGLRTFVNITLF